MVPFTSFLRRGKWQECIEIILTHLPFLKRPVCADFIVVTYTDKNRPVNVVSVYYLFVYECMVYLKKLSVA